ncbi:MAG: hypothetical protein H7A21_10190 [Spirochaetales bacterium]|nr:hypothetical protein [Spirochaetales bacterium]MCP5486909.1 hypothetical protein [Spirochaetales bacterium]
MLYRANRAGRQSVWGLLASTTLMLIALALLAAGRYGAGVFCFVLGLCGFAGPCARRVLIRRHYQILRSRWRWHSLQIGVVYRTRFRVYLFVLVLFLLSAAAFAYDHFVSGEAVLLFLSLVFLILAVSVLIQYNRRRRDFVLLTKDSVTLSDYGVVFDLGYHDLERAVPALQVPPTLTLVFKDLAGVHATVRSNCGEDQEQARRRFALRLENDAATFATDLPRRYWTLSTARFSIGASELYCFLHTSMVRNRRQRGPG